MARILETLSQPTVPTGDIRAQGDRIAGLLRAAAQPQGPDLSTGMDALNRMKSAGMLQLAGVGRESAQEAYDNRIKDVTSMRVEGEQAAYDNLLKAREMGDADADRILTLADKIAGEDAISLINAMDAEIPDEIDASNFLQYAVPKAKEKGILMTGDYRRQKEALELEGLAARNDSYRALTAKRMSGGGGGGGLSSGGAASSGESDGESPKPFTTPGQLQIYTRTLEKMRESSNASEDLINNTRIAKDALRDYGGVEGAGGETYLAADKLLGGILPGDSGLGEVVQSIGTELRLKFSDQTKGAISDREMATFQEASPGLTKTEAGNQNLLNIYEAGAQRKKNMINFFEAWSSANGGDLRGAQEQWQQYIEDNPVLQYNQKAKKFTVNTQNIGNWKNYIQGGNKSTFVNTPETVINNNVVDFNSLED